MPQLTFTTGKAELAARGFDTLSDTRLGYFFNQGRAELDNLYLWPYRLVETNASAPPLTITDLGTIEEIRDTAQINAPALDYCDRRTLRSSYGDLMLAGSPSFFYMDGVKVRTFPAGGNLIARYYKRCPDLVSGSDVPLAPSDYHLLYVDFAVRWAQKDGMQPDAVSGDVLRQLGGMVRDLFNLQVVGSDITPDTGESIDG